MSEHSVWSLPGVAAAILMAAGVSDPAPNPIIGPAAPKHFSMDGLDGPVAATVERVVDGDTIEVRARIWLGQSLVVRVRIDGIDTPELRARCDAERRLAQDARAFLARRLEGAEVKLSRVVYDKYGGRVRADVSDKDGDIAQALLSAGFGRRYNGERRLSWCE